MHLKLCFCTTLFPPKINLFISFPFLSLPFHVCHTIAKLFNSKLTSIRGSFDFRKFPRDKQYFQFGRGFTFQTNSRTDDVAIFGKILYHVENKQSRDKKKKKSGGSDGRNGEKSLRMRNSRYVFIGFSSYVLCSVHHIDLSNHRFDVAMCKVTKSPR